MKFRATASQNSMFPVKVTPDSAYCDRSQPAFSSPTMFLNPARSTTTILLKSFGVAAGDIDGDGLCLQPPATRPCATVSAGKSGSPRSTAARFEHHASQKLTGQDLSGWVSLDDKDQIVEKGQADVLYRNNSDGKFTPLTFTDGIVLDETGKR